MELDSPTTPHLIVAIEIYLNTCTGANKLENENNYFRNGINKIGIDDFDTFTFSYLSSLH